MGPRLQVSSRHYLQDIKLDYSIHVNTHCFCKVWVLPRWYSYKACISSVLHKSNQEVLRSHIGLDIINASNVLSLCWLLRWGCTCAMHRNANISRIVFKIRADKLYTCRSALSIQLSRSTFTSLEQALRQCQLSSDKVIALLLEPQHRHGKVLLNQQALKYSIALILTMIQDQDLWATNQALTPSVFLSWQI